MSSSYIIDKLQSSTTIEAPAHIFEFDKQIINLEFSPYLWSHDLICIAFIDKLRVAAIKFQVSNLTSLLSFFFVIYVVDFYFRYFV